MKRRTESYQLSVIDYQYRTSDCQVLCEGSANHLPCETETEGG